MEQHKSWNFFLMTLLEAKYAIKARYLNNSKSDKI